MKPKVFGVAAILLLVAGVAAIAWLGGYKRGYKLGFRDEANGEVKILGVTSTNGDTRVATSEGFLEVISPHQVEQLPDDLTLEELFSEWGHGYLGGPGTDPPIFWYMADREGDLFYWVFWEQRDAKALVEGQLSKVRVRTIARSGFQADKKPSVVWGAESTDVPYIPGDSPFRPSIEEE